MTDEVREIKEKEIIEKYLNCEELERKTMEEHLYNVVFHDGITSYEDYQDYMTLERYNKIVKDAEHMANIFEESWLANE